MHNNMQWTQFIKRIISKRIELYGKSFSLVYVLLFLFVVIVLSFIPSWINRENLTTLVHEDYRFAIDYPVNWNYEIYGERGRRGVSHIKALIIPYSYIFSPKVSVKVHWVSMNNPTLEQAAEWGLEIIPPYFGDIPYKGTLSDLQETQIGVDDYPSFTRTFKSDDSSEMMIFYYVVRENGAYSLEFILRNEDDIIKMEPIFNQILASFRMLN